MKKIFYILTILLAFKNVIAQKTNDTIIISKLPEVQVIALRASAKAPFTKLTINKTDIEKNNLGQDIPFILNQTPNVIINSDAGNGIGYTGIRIRGTDATRINITLNGVPFNDAESQGTYFVDIPDILSSTNSIQIQRGVGSSSNGSGAFGANISLSTNQHSIEPSIEINNSFGSFNSLKNTLKLSTGLQKHFYFDGRLSNIQSNGYVDRASSKLQSAMATFVFNNNKTDLKFNIIAGKEKTYQAWNGIDETTLQTNRTYNSAGTEKAGAPYKNEIDNYHQTHLQLILNQKINNNLNYSTVSFLTFGNGYYEQYKANQNYSNYGLPNLIQGFDTISTTDLIRQLWLRNYFLGQTFSLIYTKNKSELTFGGMLSKYNGNHYGQIIWANQGIAKNYKYYDLIANKFDNNFYIKEQYDIDNKFSLYADVQYRNVNYIINGFKDNPSIKINEHYNFINPKFGLTYNNIYQQFKSNISYSKATKEPNRDDYEANQNQLPKPETINDYEFNIEKKWKDKLQTSATFYYMKYKNQLILNGKINDVGAYTRENVLNSYRTGLELSAAFKFNSKIKLDANFAFSKNKIKAFTEYIDDYDNGGQIEINHTNSNISFSPNTVISGSISYLPTNKFTLQLLSKYVSKQYLDNTQNNNRILKSYYLQDVLIAYNPIIKKVNDCKIFMQLNNVFNKKYEPNGYTFSYFYSNKLSTENYYFPMAGFNLMIGLNIKFCKK